MTAESQPHLQEYIPIATEVLQRRTRAVCITTAEEFRRALDSGLHDAWRELMRVDPMCSAFQGPGWCRAWYDCYANTYTPFVLLCYSGDVLVGLAPMAVSKDDGTFNFASGSSADYRDIVARPGYRATILDALVREYVERKFPNVLEVGLLDPSSDTPRLLAEICETRGLRSVTRHHKCWRWFPPPPSKPNAQKFLNWFRRQGEVTFEVVETQAQWLKFRQQYFLHHSLRQLQAGRTVAFEDPNRVAFYDALFESADIDTHVSGFFVNDEFVAGHFGTVWRQQLLLGPSAIRLEDEQRSPAVILLSWIIQNAASLGLASFDMTIGDTDFKRRLGNQCVELTIVEVHRTERTYLEARARQRVMAVAKTAAARFFGEDAWKHRVLPLASRAGYKRARLAELGIVEGAKRAVGSLVGRLWRRDVGLVYAIDANQYAERPHRGATSHVQIHENRIEDLLLWQGSSLETSSVITECARGFSRLRAADRTLHTVVVEGKLAGWGYSYAAEGITQLTETPGATLEFPDGATSLYDFHTIPEFRGRGLYTQLLDHILRQRFDAGAKKAFITVLESNVASRKAIERVGFVLAARNHYSKTLRRVSIRTESLG